MKLSSFVSVALVLAACTVARSDIMLTNTTVYTQNFDTMSAATNGTSSSLMPANWFMNDTLYVTNAGGTATADVYSYGANLVAERALGSLATTGVRFGAKFQNAGPKNMTKILSLAYTGERWRLGATGRTDKLDFQYSLDATSLTTGTWFDINTLDYTAPAGAGATGAKDGNLAANQTSVVLPVKTLFNSPVAPGGVFWIRWSDTDATGADDGLGIDNFSIQAIPEPSSFALCGVIIAGIMGFSVVRRRQQRLA